MKRGMGIWGRKHVLVMGCLLLALGAPTRRAEARILCVGNTWTGGACGSIYTDLQEALSASRWGDEIWVEKGTYKPTSGADRTATFPLNYYVRLYGGFNGSESARRDRNWKVNVTILSGDIGVPGDISDNSYHVVTGTVTDRTTILDGFTITGGHAEGIYPEDYYYSRGAGMHISEGSAAISNVTFSANHAADLGGGMYTDGSNPTLSNVSFSGNSASSGGGMCTFGGSPLLSNVTFSSNSSTMNGGGMFNFRSSPALFNVTFSGNSTGYDGGGMFNTAAGPLLCNAVFIGNSAPGEGGGMYSHTSSPALSNVTFSANSSGNGGGMYNWTSNPKVSNSIFWGNSGGEIRNNIYSSPTVVYSLVQGGHPGEGNLDADPLFMDAVNGDLRLRPGSPALDAGRNHLIARDLADLNGNGNTTEPVPYDLAGRPRIARGIVDMGAYEHQGVLCVGDRWTEHSTCDSIYADLHEALSAAPRGMEIWVERGTYKPTAGTDRTATFQLKSGVALYGGFTGRETARGERDEMVNVTSLSGEIGTKGDHSDNSYHVVTGSGTDRTAILDGFTITGGHADGSFPYWAFGAGLYNSDGNPAISNMTFRRNFADYGAGGMYNLNSSPLLSNVAFSNNSATYGGAMVNRNGSPLLANVTFSGNSATYGGGMYSVKSDAVLFNVSFNENSATKLGGGMYNNSSNPTLSNVTFNANSARQEGGGMFNKNSSPVLSNCILWGDSGGEIRNNPASSPTVTYSLVHGGYLGVGNLAADPLFVDAAKGDLRLQPRSPAIDAGLNDLIARDYADLNGNGNTAEPVPYDLDGKPRIVHRIVDMGAHEHQGVICVGDGWTESSICDFIYADLHEALPAAPPGDEIWVERGTYKPTAGKNRTATFQLKSGVALYGGFTGSETARRERDWRVNVTTLSGDIGTRGDHSDNSYHVVTGSDTRRTAILDGFMITGGNSSAPGEREEDDSGGGMYTIGGSPLVCNVTFSGNSASRGGGMFNDGKSYGTSGSPFLSNVTFSGNSADYGGGMFDLEGSPLLSNVTFSGNSATYGGGMHTIGGSPLLCNVIFSANSAAEFGGGMFYVGTSLLSNVTFSGNSASRGGGIYMVGSRPEFSNVTFSGNSADYGGGMFNRQSSPSLYNSILWGDSGGEIHNVDSRLHVRHSLVQGGGGNLDADPLFVDAVNGDLRLQAGSPAIDAGRDDFIARDFADLNGDGDTAEPVPYDLDGKPRVSGPSVDMGAYEYQY